MKTLRMHRIASRVLVGSIASVIIAAQPDVVAAVLLSTGSGTYTQSFDLLSASGTANTWTDDSTLLGWYAAKSVAPTTVATYRADTGSGNAGALYSFGSSGNSDRALGTLGSATPGNFAFGVLFENKSGGDLSLNAFSFFGEQWRNGGNATAQTMSFSYRISSSPIVAFDASGVTPVDWTPLSSLNFTSPIATVTAAALDGNLSANREQKSATLGITLPSTQFIAFRWFDANDAGSDHGLSIDDLELVYTTAGAPVGRNLIWSPVTGVWDLSVQNWTEVGIPGTPVAFQSQDRATFDDTGLANGSTVTITAAGVTIGNTKVTNTTGTYTFVGGAIGGSGSLTKTGAGKLVLSSANAYTGATTVTEGTVSISADDQLGAATAPLSIGATGTLETTGSLTLNSTRPVSGSGTVKIAPSTTLQIAGPANTGIITLSSTGTLSFASAASAQIGGFTIQDASNLAATLPILLNGPFTTTNAAGTVTVTAALNLGAATRIFNIADGSAATDITLSGNLSSTSAGGRLHKLGDGTLEFLADNSGLLGGVQLGTAGATPVNGGTLILNNNQNLGPGGTGTAGQFRFNPGTLIASVPIQFPASLSMSIGSSAPLASTFAGSDVEFLGATSFFSTGGVQHIIVANSNVRFASPLTGTTAGLSVRGTGSLTLAAGGTFVSDVVVDSGKLIVLGNLGGPLTTDNRPAITVIANGVLSGTVSGTDVLSNPLALGSLIAGDLTTAGTISPGTAADPTAVLTAFGTISPIRDALSILSNGILAMDIGGLNVGDYDQIAATGTVNLAGMLNVSVLNGFAPTVGDTFTLILNDDVDLVAGTFSGKAEGSQFTANGYSFRINYGAGDGNDVVLTTTVPEPGSAVLLLGGLGLLGLRRRRNALFR